MRLRYTLFLYARSHIATVNMPLRCTVECLGWSPRTTAVVPLRCTNYYNWKLSMAIAEGYLRCTEDNSFRSTMATEKMPLRFTLYFFCQVTYGNSKYAFEMNRRMTCKMLLLCLLAFYGNLPMAKVRVALRCIVDNNCK